jgi:hypothetical protein
MNHANGLKVHPKIEENIREIKVFILFNILLKNIKISIYKKANMAIHLQFNYHRTYLEVFYLTITMLKFNIV